MAVASGGGNDDVTPCHTEPLAPNAGLRAAFCACAHTDGLLGHHSDRLSQAQGWEAGGPHPSSQLSLASHHLGNSAFKKIPKLASSALFSALTIAGPSLSPVMQ